MTPTPGIHLFVHYTPGTVLGPGDTQALEETAVFSVTKQQTGFLLLL